MLVMRYVGNEVDMSGTLTVEATPGDLARLNALAIELQNRPEIALDGVAVHPPDPPPVIEDEG
jgi:hypothetical protein